MSRRWRRVWGKYEGLQIIGTGLVARALAGLPAGAQGGRDGALIFAAGVADSACLDPEAFRREREALRDWATRCRDDGRRLVYVSSAGAVYGSYEGPRDEQTACAPETAYGRHKLACEEAIRESGCLHLVLRVPHLVGPRQNPCQLIPSLVRQAQAGRAVLFRDATRDLVGIDRFAAIVAELLANAASRETVVVASGASRRVTAIFAVIQEILGARGEVRVEPRGDQQEYCIDRLRRLAPTSTDYAEDEPEAVLRAYVPALAGDAWVYPRSCSSGGRT
jgi:nucleoside-diphosphate-sugar epimerase